jgi:hypothetical protein
MSNSEFIRVTGFTSVEVFRLLPPAEEPPPPPPNIGGVARDCELLSLLADIPLPFSDPINQFVALLSQLLPEEGEVAEAADDCGLLGGRS